MSATTLLRLRLPCEASAPRQARQALAELPEIGPMREDALLVASELATNAVMHSGCLPGEEFELCAQWHDECLRISVCDPGRSGEEPLRRGADPSRPGGMGLAVVEQIARSWGAERGKLLEVWAELSPSL